MNTATQKKSRKSVPEDEADDWSPDVTKKARRGKGKATKETGSKKNDTSAYEYFGGATTVVSTSFSSSNWLPSSILQPQPSSSTSSLSTHITVIDDCAGSPQGPPVLQLSNSSIISAAVVSGSTSTSTNGATKTTTSSTSCVIFKPTNLTQNSVHQIREREKQIVSGIASSFYAMLKAPPTAEPAIVSQPVPEKKESVEKKKSTPLTFSTDIPENFDFEKLLSTPLTPALTKSVDEPILAASATSTPSPNPFYSSPAPSTLSPIASPSFLNTTPSVPAPTTSARSSKSKSKATVSPLQAPGADDYKPFTFTFSGKYTFG